MSARPACWLALALALGGPLAASVDCVTLRPSLRPAAAASIGLFPDSRLPLAVVERSIEAWAACSPHASGLPPMRVGESGTRDLEIEFDPRAVGSEERCGSFSGRKITLFSRTRTHAGAVVRCGSLAQNLTHEIGHALGLADAPKSCRSFAMSKLGPGNIYHRRVRAAECRALNGRWRPLPGVTVAAGER